MDVIVVCYPAAKRHLAQIAAAHSRAELVVADERTLAQEILRATILCGHVKVPVDWEAVVRLGRLQWIQSTAAGLDHCLVPAVVDSPIVVSSASGVFADQVAEQTLALLLGLLRGLPRFFRAGLARTFQRQPTEDLHGKTVGIVGFGGNGRRLAEVLKPFRCQFIATDYFAEPSSDPAAVVLPPDGLDQLLREADIVIVTLPLTPETRGLIGASAIARMKAGAYLINVGRGGIVDEHALCEALAKGHLAGAGLDVFETEPLPPTSPLWDSDRVLLTPHVGAQSAGRLDDVTKLFCRNLRCWQRGERLWNIVDKRLGFPAPRDRLPRDWRTG